MAGNTSPDEVAPLSSAVATAVTRAIIASRSHAFTRGETTAYARVVLLECVVA